jgi:uncharacterized DUF497 family protein
MEIEFDPAKDEANIAKHGVSLGLAAEFDLAAAIILVDDRKDYGETRFRAFGRIGGLAYCLAFALRPAIVRIISLRRAHADEMARHGA